MTRDITTTSSSASASSDLGRGLKYLVIAVLANAAFWSIASFMMKDAPKVYTSEWSIIPVGGTKANVNIPDIGSAEARTESPFSKEADVKGSYKLIAATDVVRKTAAAKLGMTSGQFGKPRVEVVEGTAFMNFTISGSTPEEAQKKAYAMHESFQERLNQLRVQQAAEQEAGFENSLSVARKKLETAQLRLSDYKVRSGLASKDQVDQLAGNIEGLRRLKAEVEAQQRDAATRSRRLSTNLQTGSRLASEAFTLRADPLLQQYLRDYSEATASFKAMSSKYGENHPLVVRDRAKQDALQAALRERAQALLGRPMDDTALARINLGGAQVGTAREGLFKDILTNDAEQVGLTARAREIDRQMSELERRLSVLAQRSSTLEALSRDMQIAEAVFSSTLAGLDASKSDIFGAYPPVQLVSEPSLPGEATIPQRQSLFMGAMAGSVLVTAGLLLLWLRKTSFARHLLRRSSAPSTVV